jgi:hypothetical protein
VLQQDLVLQGLLAAFLVQEQQQQVTLQLELHCREVYLPLWALHQVQ